MTGYVCVCASNQGQKIGSVRVQREFTDVIDGYMHLQISMSTAAYPVSVASSPWPIAEPPSDCPSVPSRLANGHHVPRQLRQEVQLHWVPRLQETWRVETLSPVSLVVAGLRFPAKSLTFVG